MVSFCCVSGLFFFFSSRRRHTRYIGDWSSDVCSAGAASGPADVVGPICETGDTFATERDLPPLAEGDLVALTDAGAYGAVMSSTYNSRLLVPEVMVGGGRFAVIRARPT